MAHNGKLHSADVVAVFKNQLDADEAVLQLRMAGFRERDIGYFVWHPMSGLTNLLDRNYAFVGAVAGGIVGAMLGVGLAQLLHQWSMAVMDVRDSFGLMVTCAVFSALFVGVIGWGIGVGVQREGVQTPAIDPAVGPFIIAVSAGEARERAWGIIHRRGGHELPPGSLMAHPTPA